MRVIFVDTFYWIALINKKDTWHQKVREFSKTLINVKFVRTHEVLIETANFFASFPQEIKQSIYQLIAQIVNDSNIKIVTQSEDSFSGFNFI